MLGLEKEKPPDYIPTQEYKIPSPVLCQPARYMHPEPALAPAQSGWAALPAYTLFDCPPGLEYLATIDQLLVHQKVELFEAITGFESNNKYTIKNSQGQKVYVAVEDNTWLNRMGGAMRPFDIKIFSTLGKEVIHLHRPLACHGCLCPLWLQQLEVCAPPGVKVGSVEQEWSCMRPQYSVRNAAGETVLTIKGPTCRFSFAVEFAVVSRDGKTQVGRIVKHWSGLAREVFTDADYFGIGFPADLDVNIKAVLLGACFLIDYMFFED